MSTPELANDFKRKNPGISNIYGDQLIENLHLWHYYVYEETIPVDTVLINERYGGTDAHSGGSFYTAKTILKIYNNFVNMKCSSK